MALKSLVDKLTGKSDRGSWQPAAGPYPRLISMDEAAPSVLKNKGGVFALWHRGVRPQWIYIGYTPDLWAALLAAQGQTLMWPFTTAMTESTSPGRIVRQEHVLL